jgi:hypothetical protein
MRKIIIALSAVAFAAGASGIEAYAAKAPAKTTLGCVKGKEKWDASTGKCVAAKPVKKAK